MELNNIQKGTNTQQNKLRKGDSNLCVSMNVFQLKHEYIWGNIPIYQDELNIYTLSLPQCKFRTDLMPSGLVVGDS